MMVAVNAETSCEILNNRINFRLTVCSVICGDGGRFWTEPRLSIPRICYEMSLLETVILRQFSSLALILLTWKIWWVPNNASKWQMGFNSAFEGLIEQGHEDPTLGPAFSSVLFTYVSVGIIWTYRSRLCLLQEESLKERWKHSNIYLKKTAIIIRVCHCVIWRPVLAVFWDPSGSKCLVIRPR